MTANILSQIHHSTFNTFVYKTDIKQHGVHEKWSMPADVTKHGTLTGDCEDFALSCRQQCRAAGIASQLIVCKDETGELHCALHVNGWVLDNRHPQLKTVDELTKLGYTWIAISGNNPGDQWHRISTKKG